MKSSPPSADGGRITIRSAGVCGPRRHARPGRSRPSRRSARAGPRRVAALTAKTWSPRASRSARTMSAISRPSGTSILLSATRRGRSSRPPYDASSCSITSRSSTGLRPGSMVAVSITCTMAAHRSTWRRNSWPRPRPSLAPSIRPGTSATVYVVSPARDHAEVGDQRGERVVGDLGPGPRDRGDQARLAGAGEADQPDVGDHLELEHDLELVARLAEQREPGRLALGAGERGVAQAAATALGDDELGAGADEVGEHLAARRWRRPCRRGRGAPGRRRGRRCGGRRRRGRRARPCGGGCGGSRAAWSRRGRPAGSPSRRGRRCRRRDRRAA